MPHIDTRTARISFDVTGEGPDLVLVQGVGVPGSGWGPQQESLSRHFRVVTIDNRGIGQSTRGQEPLTIDVMADDIRAVLDALEVRQAHFGGHSMGGLLATHFALAHPDRVRSLMLLCSLFRGSDAARVTLWKSWVGLRCHLGTRKMRRRAFLEMLLPDGVMSRQERDAYAIEIEAVFGRDLAVQPPIVMAQLKALRHHRYPAPFESIQKKPCLVISGKEDRIAPPSYGEMLAQALKCPFECWPNSAHGLPIRHAERLNSRWLTFLQGVDAREGAI